MPHLQPLIPATAPPEVQGVYEDFYRKMEFPAPPNFILTQGHSPTVARGTWDLVRNVLVSGRIPRWKKEMMFVAISRDRNCLYCAAAHVACCRMLGADPQVLEALLSDITRIKDPQLRDMILFAVKCSRVPQELDAGDFEHLRRTGLGESEIMEIIAMSGLAVYANIIADAAAVEPDAMFDQL